MGTNPLDANHARRAFRERRRRAVGWLVIGMLLPGMARSAGPCMTDIEKFCSNVPMGDGRIQTCLHEHERELSSECAARHGDLEKEMGRLAATCRYDISRFCWDVVPGHGRVTRCLDRHRMDLSSVCNDQLRKAARD